ncbi:MAG: GIY-YIG nuclease family protein [Verrucomicrobiaceae bacterium]|nr:MAG: GIY-YIG nuclease family protein [Verrucomicrobiaceae bacterium]
MNDYYVYLLLDPRKCWIPFYVGKGKGGRAQMHLRESAKKSSNPRRWNVIQRIRAEGLEPKILKWKENLLESEAYDLEAQLIERFGRRGYDDDGILTNIQIDSRPPVNNRPCSDEKRRKIGDANRGKKRTNEMRAEMSRTRKGRVCGPMSDERKEKIRQGNIGTTRPPKTDQWKAEQSDRVKAIWARRKAAKYGDEPSNNS